MREEINRLLLHAPRMCSTDTALMMRERYETLFNIFNHDQPGVPGLSLVTMHPAENISSGSPIQRRMDDFVLYDVGKVMNISIVEFLNCPRDYCDMMIKAARKQQNTAASAIAAAEENQRTAEAVAKKGNKK